MWEKEKYFEVKEADCSLRTTKTQKIKKNYKKNIDGLKHGNEVLRDKERQQKIKETDNLFDSVNKRSQLEKCVINIELSNN